MFSGLTNSRRNLVSIFHGSALVGVEGTACISVSSLSIWTSDCLSPVLISLITITNFVSLSPVFVSG